MLKEAMEALREAERPVLIFGAGVRAPPAAAFARALARWLGVPVAVTWGARDLFPAGGDAFCVGGFGTHGTRAANFAVQNADWILSVGSRLDSKATGTPRHYFARAARIFMVDIDPAEIAKFHGTLGREFQGAQADAALFLRDACALARELPPLNFQCWKMRCRYWLEHYPAIPREAQGSGVDPYRLVRALSDICWLGETIVSDTGLALAWMMQAFDFKPSQSFVHALNQTPMGYGLPAAIGAAHARPGERVTLITGDGGLMLNIQELSLLAKHALPIKVVLFNNGGHAMCRQTQEQWLGGNYYSTSPEHGLAMPDFADVAHGFGLTPWRIFDDAELGVLRDAMEAEGPALVDVRVGGDRRLIPQVAYGSPNEDGAPKLPRDELRGQMIVGTVDG